MSLRSRGVRVVAAVVACLAAGSVLAADLALPPPRAPAYTAAPWAGWISEFKFGVYDQDLKIISTRKHEDAIALNGEVRFIAPTWSTPYSWVNFLITPRPTVGGSFAIATGDRPVTSGGYGGVTYTIPVWGPLYFDWFFGVFGHDGNANFDYIAFNHDHPNNQVNQNDYRKFVGCPVLFRENAELGYRFGEDMNQSISLNVTHLSHGEFLCNDSRNSGMDSVGIKYGWKF